MHGIESGGGGNLGFKCLGLEVQKNRTQDLNVWDWKWREDRGFKCLEVEKEGIQGSNVWDQSVAVSV